MSRDTVFAIMEAQHKASQAGKLSIWTIYDHPLDFPNGFISRRFEVGGGAPEPTPTSDTMTGELDDIRSAFIKAGLTRLTRNDDDEAQVVECWL